jgi:Putative Flp pilus-assembly TadE/G-like
MYMISWIFDRFFDLAHNRRGAIMPLVAGGIIALVASVGLATDAARGYMAKARLVQALDAAALAGGRAMFSPTRDADIQMYFEANFPTDFMGATINGPSITVTQNDELLTLQASATIDTTFMQLLGFQTLKVSAETEVTRLTQLLDVVIAIDMSGSMNSGVGGGVTRIQAARDAAKILVGILFGQDAIKDKLKIGLVPWNGKVNVTLNGTMFDSAQTTTSAVDPFTNPLTGAVQNQVFVLNNSPVPVLSPPPADWKGCVYSRFLDNADPGDDADVILGSLSSPMADWVSWEPVGPEGEPVPGFAKCTGAVGNNECRPCLSHGITPMQSTRATIDTAIDELIQPVGVTNITQGLGWAWRVLSPTAPFTEADPNPPGRRQQAIILLTDGENYAGSGDGYKTVFGYGSAGRPDMNDRLRTLSANIKGADVTIYAIQFANNGGPLQDLMKDVATSPDSPFYNYAPDAAALEQVFREVANNLSELRLSK